MVLAFSSWVLAAISIRWIHTVFASYYKPDPATIVAGLLLWAYLLSSKLNSVVLVLDEG